MFPIKIDGSSGHLKAPSTQSFDSFLRHIAPRCHGLNVLYFKCLISMRKMSCFFRCAEV